MQRILASIVVWGFCAVCHSLTSREACTRARFDTGGTLSFGAWLLITGSCYLVFGLAACCMWQLITTEFANLLAGLNVVLALAGAVTWGINSECGMDALFLGKPRVDVFWLLMPCAVLLLMIEISREAGRKKFHAHRALRRSLHK